MSANDQRLDNSVTGEDKRSPINTTTGIASNKCSRFWVASSDFYIAIPLFANDIEGLVELQEVFSEITYATKDANFGIDNHRFINNGLNQQNYLLPDDKAVSYYWISSGGLHISFIGKAMTTEAILRLFDSIRDNIRKDTVLRFGVDTVEFAYIFP